MKTICLAAICMALGMAGCEHEPDTALNSGAESASANEASATAIASAEPGVVELSEAQAVMDDDGIVHFKIHYRFTSGAPVKTYLCNVRFPGTDQTGVKPMESFELRTDGTFSMGIEVGDNPVDGFEITFSEADSPDRGYSVISNTLTGRLALPADRS